MDLHPAEAGQDLGQGQNLGVRQPGANRAAEVEVQAGAVLAQTECQSIIYQARTGFHLMSG